MIVRLSCRQLLISGALCASLLVGCASSNERYYLGYLSNSCTQVLQSRNNVKTPVGYKISPQMASSIFGQSVGGSCKRRYHFNMYIGQDRRVAHDIRPVYYIIDVDFFEPLKPDWADLEKYAAIVDGVTGAVLRTHALDREHPWSSEDVVHASKIKQ